MDATVKTFDKLAQQYATFTFDKILQFEINKFISLMPKKAKVLDVGSGSGRDVNYFLDYDLDPIGIDLSENMLKEAKKRVKKGNFMKMDMKKKLDFPKESFDGIWCCVTFSHIKKKEVPKILKEFKRVLKPRGHLYLSVRKGNGEAIEKDKKYNNLPIHMSYYKPKEIEKYLKEIGFEIHNISISEGKVDWINVYAKNPEQDISIKD